MSGPQTAPARATLAASPSNFPESPCHKARSRLRAALRPVVSRARVVSACSASRARPSPGNVGWHARCRADAEDHRHTGRLPTPPARGQALYEVVRDNLETLLGAINEGALAVRIPRNARKELLAHLDCGLLCGPKPGFAPAALPD